MHCFIHAIDSDACSPLAFAIQHGQISTAEILMQVGSTSYVNLQYREILSVDCYKIAIVHEQFCALRFLLHRHRPEPQHLDELLIYAINRGQTETIYPGFWRKPKRATYVASRC